METAEGCPRMKTRWWKKRGVALIVVLMVAGWHATGHSDPDNPTRPRMFYAQAGQAPDAEANLGRSKEKSAPSIRDPGPDFADFPDSAEVVPPTSRLHSERSRRPCSRGSPAPAPTRFRGGAGAARISAKLFLRRETVEGSL